MAGLADLQSAHGARQFLWHLHAIVATWVLPFYLVMALTGLYWSYEWYRDGLVALFDASPPAGAVRRQGLRTGSAHEFRVPSQQPHRAWQSFRDVGRTGIPECHLRVVGR